MDDFFNNAVNKVYKLRNCAFTLIRRFEPKMMTMTSKQSVLKTFFTGGVVKQDSNTAAMDVDMVAKCIHMSRSCPEIRACISYMKTNILAKGIEMTRADQQTTHEFYMHMQEYYARFCSDAIDVAMIVGVVPYILVKNGKGYGYPLVLKPDTGMIRVEYADNGSVKYSFTFNDSESVKSRVFFEVFKDIGRNGEICSTLSSIAQAYDFIQAQELNTFMANEIAARPPVFLTTGDSTFTEKDLVNRDIYGDGIVAEQEFQSQLMRNRIQLNVVQAQKTYLKYMSADGKTAEPDFFGATRDRLTGFPIVDYTRGTSFQPEFVPLPSNCAPTNATLPRAPEGLQQHRDHFRTVVCASFAIPTSILTGTMPSTTSSSSSDAMSGSLRTMFEFFKNKLSNLCLKAYRLLHEDSSPDVRIVFPSLINIGTYETLYKEGILTYDAYKDQLSKTYGIPIGAFEKTPRPPIVPENQRGQQGVVAPVKKETRDTADNHALKEKKEESKLEKNKDDIGDETHEKKKHKKDV